MYVLPPLWLTIAFPWVIVGAVVVPAGGGAATDPVGCEYVLGDGYTNDGPP